MADVSAPDEPTLIHDLADLPWTLMRSFAAEAPSPALDPYLDAVAAVLERQGWSKTTIPDIARLMGVSRTTVYRQLGSVDSAVRLLAAREIRRLASSLPRQVPLDNGARAISRVLAATVSFVSSHPVVRKLIHDEPALIAAAAISAHVTLVSTLRPAIVPALEAGMAAGALARRNTDFVTDWLVRIGTSLVLNPPPEPVLAFVDSLILPLLEPRDAGR